MSSLEEEQSKHSVKKLVNSDKSSSCCPFVCTHCVIPQTLTQGPHFNYGTLIQDSKLLWYFQEQDWKVQKYIISINIQQIEKQGQNIRGLTNIYILSLCHSLLIFNFYIPFLVLFYFYIISVKNKTFLTRILLFVLMLQITEEGLIGLKCALLQEVSLCCVILPLSLYPP